MAVKTKKKASTKIEAERLFFEFLDKGKAAWKLAISLTRRGNPDLGTDVVLDAMEEKYQALYSEQDWDRIRDILNERIYNGLT